MQFFTYRRLRSPLLPPFTYSIESVATKAPLGRVGHNEGKRGWHALPHGASRPLPGRFYTRRDAAQALWHHAPSQQ